MTSPLPHSHFLILHINDAYTRLLLIDETPPFSFPLENHLNRTVSNHRALSIPLSPHPTPSEHRGRQIFIRTTNYKAISRREAELMRCHSL